MPASHSSCPLFAAGESSTGATLQLIENPLLVKSTYLPTYFTTEVWIARNYPTMAWLIPLYTVITGKKLAHL